MEVDYELFCDFFLCKSVTLVQFVKNDFVRYFLFERVSGATVESESARFFPSTPLPFFRCHVLVFPRSA